MRKALQLALLLLIATPSWGAISKIGGCAAATTSCTMPGNAVGDYIYAFAFRSALTAPTLGSGFTTIATNSASTSSFRAGCKVATTTTEVSGTWTNATSLTVEIYRGANATLTANCATVGMSIGTTASGTGATSTINYPALTMSNTDGKSWVIGASGSSGATCTPSGMTSSQNQTTVNILNDTNGGVSAWSSTNCTGTTGNWKSNVVELIPRPTYTTTVTLIGSATQSIASCVITAPSGVAQGHLVLFGTVDNTASTVFVTAATDSASNTYNFKDAAALDVSDGVGAIIGSGYMANAIGAGGTITITQLAGGCIAYDVSTGASSTWLDQAASNDNSSFAAPQSSGTTAATVHQPNVNFSTFGGANGCAAATWPYPWINLTNFSNSSRCLYVYWEEVTATGAQNLTINIAAGDTTAATIGSYKEGGAVAACTPSLTLLGVGRCG